MADLSEIEAAGSTKIVGSDAAGVEATPVKSTTNGALHTNLRDNAGTETATAANPLRTDPTGSTTQPVSVASLPLPAGAATAANQATGNASLASIDAGIPAALGAATAANSMPVTIASDQVVPVSAASLPLPTGAATAAAQATGNASLASIDAGIPNALGAATIANSMPVNLASDQVVPVAGLNPSGVSVPLKADANGILKTRPNSDTSVFGSLVTGSRVQQIGVDFSQTIANNDVTQSTTGTGAIAIANYSALLSTGVGVTSSAKLQSTGSTTYVPGREIYAQFTVAFTAPTSAASFQRAGLYNTNDGLFIGYNGTSFGITSRVGAVDTFVPSASFNIDTLTGAANSLFTRANTPEAINYAYKNVYRIRAGWLGAAPIFFEVMSADGVWVLFHVIRQPNSSLNPAFGQASLPFTMEVGKASSDATNLQVKSTSWDAGIVDQPNATDFSNSGSIASNGSAVTINTSSRATVVADVSGTWTGTIQVQADVGDGTWNSIYAVNTQATAANTITANATLIISCAGFAQIRLIATAWSSGTANINWSATSNISLVMAQAIGNIASGSPDTGNPIKVGGVYNTTLPNVASGSRVDLQLDSSGRLLTSTAVTSQLPAATIVSQTSIETGITKYTSYTATQKLAIKQFYAGGTGVGKQTLYTYLPSSTAFITSGDFETAGDINTIWNWISAGGTGSIASSTAQVQTGSRSVALTFTNSSGTNAQGVKQTFSSPVDYSGWRYISAYFFNTLSAGGGYTRTISIILTDSGGNTRLYSVSGTSVTAPFNASNWIQILGEIENPTSAVGTAFDTTAIASIELRMSDTGNKAGTVYWDTVKLTGAITTVFPIYHLGNLGFNIPIDPVVVLNIGDQVLIAQKNNDASRKEYFASANGVSIT